MSSKSRIGPSTLFGRTGLTVAIAFLLFFLFVISVDIALVHKPTQQQAAEELAASISLAAKTWIELPPDTRPDFELEMETSHHLRIMAVESTMLKYDGEHRYLQALLKELSKRLGDVLTVRIDEASPGWLWVEFPIGGRVLSIGFESYRLDAHLPLALMLNIAAGAISITVVTLILVGRLTKPLARMVAATETVGRTSQHLKLPEEGPRELALLAHGFNQMDEQIRELLAGRTTLLAGISHDLRTPIARMRLAVEMLPEDLDPETQQGMLDDLEEMENLITQSLELARGVYSDASSFVNLAKILRTISEDYARGGIQVDVTIRGIITITAPVDALRRVISNFLDNANRYSHGKAIDIECFEEDVGAHIHIADRGPGIPEEFHRAVFEPFWRMESSRSHATGGSGLGMAIAKQICISNSWHISLDTSEYGGLLVKLFIPTSSKETI